VWFHKVVAPQCKGEACLIRFADDFVCAFERQEDAQRFYHALGQRLEKFGLTLSAEKTRVIPFSQHISPGKTSFDFLGFEFRWGKDRKGQPHVMRRTARKKLNSSLRNFKTWCKENRHIRLKELFERLNAKLRGYYNYFGVIGNFASLQLFFFKALKILKRYLNQRSQRKSYNWAGFLQLIKEYHIEKPRIVRRPKTRMGSSVA
jgi:RNA-directed DNA polymerase